jgi:REP element-mobilizing transposase RayT
MREYRRRLPHRDAPGVPTFITWRLHGSLPAERAFHGKELSSGKVFVTWDRLLDTATTGPVYLKMPEIASLIVQQLRTVQDNRLCSIDAYVVMPNHVHVLWTPISSLAELVHRVKGATAFRPNRMLERTGVFWQDEYFDRLVRTREELEKIRDYIEWNPVKAGLVDAPEDFQWSSAWRG